jgi:hypothetical protein
MAQLGIEIRHGIRALHNAAAARGITTDPYLRHLYDVVHFLWKELERYERTVQLTADGVIIKVGKSEVTILNNGGILLIGDRILLQTPTKSWSSMG